MPHTALRRSVQLALMAGALCAPSACAHRAGGGGGTEMTAAQMDSIRIAAADKAAKKRLNSGAQAVDFTDDDRNRFSTVAQMIQARFSGVSVSQRGAGYQIRIRGSESFSSGIEPLLIVDGAQMNSTADLASVNPKDVARIEILKDAAASIYGVRGGNGVIVVTTRRIP